jgi:hypothetical protein
MDALHRRQDFHVSGLLCFQQGASVHECELFTEVPGVFAYEQVAFLPCAVVLIGFVCGVLACGPEHMETVDTSSLSLQLGQQNDLRQAVRSSKRDHLLDTHAFRTVPRRVGYVLPEVMSHVVRVSDVNSAECAPNIIFIPVNESFGHVD